MGNIVRPDLSRPAVLAIASLLCVASGLCPPAAAKGPAPFVPDPAAKAPGAPPLLEGRSWTDDTPGYAIRVQHIDDAQRLAYLKHVTGLNTDPFAAPPESTLHFTTFAIQIENRGTDGVSFTPDATWLTSDRQRDLLTPYGLDELAFDYRTTGASFPPAYKHAEKALLQYPTEVAGGDTLSGLLIFRSVPNTSKRMQLELSITLATGDTVEFKAPYRRQTRKELRQEAATEDTK